MKKLIIVLIGLIISAGIIFADVKLIEWIFILVPQSGWSGLIKVTIVFIDILFTFKLCVLPFGLCSGIAARL
jgi:hypothetical protein